MISSVVMFELGLPHPIRDTYSALRVLAWGRAETPDLTKDQIEHYTGKDFKTLYRHLPVLTSYGVLRVRHVSSGFYRLVFTDGLHGAENCLKIENSQKRELPLNSINPIPQKFKSSKKSKSGGVKRGGSLKIENVLKNETPEGLGEPEKHLLKYYVHELVGYDPGYADDGELEALRFLAANHTAQQVGEAYQHLKRDPFWAGQLIKLAHLRTRVPEYLRAKQAGTLGAPKQQNGRPGKLTGEALARARAAEVQARMRRLGVSDE